MVGEDNQKRQQEVGGEGWLVVISMGHFGQAV